MNENYLLEVMWFCYYKVGLRGEYMNWLII